MHVVTLRVTIIGYAKHMQLSAEAKARPIDN